MASPEPFSFEGLELEIASQLEASVAEKEQQYTNWYYGAILNGSAALGGIILNVVHEATPIKVAATVSLGGLAAYCGKHFYSSGQEYDEALDTKKHFIN